MLPVLCATDGPADLPRIPCAECGITVVRDHVYGPLARYLCPACTAALVQTFRAEGRGWVGAFQGHRAVEALRLFLAPTGGRPS